MPPAFDLYLFYWPLFNFHSFLQIKKGPINFSDGKLSSSLTNVKIQQIVWSKRKALETQIWAISRSILYRLLNKALRAPSYGWGCVIPITVPNFLENNQLLWEEWRNPISGKKQVKTNVLKCGSITAWYGSTMVAVFEKMHQNQLNHSFSVYCPNPKKQMV